jgi:hypothetical protein
LSKDYLFNLFYNINTPCRKTKRQSRKADPETWITFETRQRTKTKSSTTKHKNKQKIKNNTKVKIKNKTKENKYKTKNAT